MDKSRRTFLKLAGGTVLLAAGGQVAKEALAAGNSHGKAKATGTQWAMVIDLQKLAGKDTSYLQSACHTTHNVPNIGGKKHEIKWFWSAPFENAFPNQQTGFAPEFIQDKDVPVLCNHCENPPCVRACPTKATFKRSDGIVAMDFHRCIGCRFCVSACPYGARSLNFLDPRPFIKKENKDFPTRTKGVVEKCNFCVERLAKGLQPACVAACSDNELVFGDLNDPHSKVRQILNARYAIVRKPNMGTIPKVFYVV